MAAGIDLGEKLEIIEHTRKGLGQRVIMKFGQLGSVEDHRRFAVVVRDGELYNIQITDNLEFPQHRDEDSLDMPVYLFPKMVSWEEARLVYCELR